MTKVKLKGWSIECLVEWDHGAFLASGAQEHTSEAYVHFGYAFAETRGKAIAAFLGEPEDAGYGPDTTWLDFRATRETKLDGHESKFTHPEHITTWWYRRPMLWEDPNLIALCDLRIINRGPPDELADVRSYDG